MMRAFQGLSNKFGPPLKFGLLFFMRGLSSLAYIDDNRNIYFNKSVILTQLQSCTDSLKDDYVRILGNDAFTP